ncbi:MAG: fatty acid desaturase [Deltaproteobacteria bacterium]|nr:fatty acid desaturase [Deltaproteobacteria bacterium]
MDIRYPVLSWRCVYDITFAWFAIAACWFLVLSISWWLYPLACPIIANRLLALSLIGHEGLHRTVYGNSWANDWLARYFCAFPTLISFSKYRRLHLLHHSSAGCDHCDPDRHLYDFYPRPALRFSLNFTSVSRPFEQLSIL